MANSRSFWARRTTSQVAERAQRGKGARVATALVDWARRSGCSEHLDTAAAIFGRIGAGGDWLVWLATLRHRIIG